MKTIYISLPISGHEDTYEQRLGDAVAYVKEKYPEYERIITPKEVAKELEDLYSPTNPEYKDYLTWDIGMIKICDAILMCDGWNNSYWCSAEWAFAIAIGLTILYQD